MRTIVMLFLLAATVAFADTGEVSRFWKDFPGFGNVLASYGYDRHFAATAKPAFVDEVVADLGGKVDERRIGEYVCVLYYMDPKVVDGRLSALGKSSSTGPMRRAVESVVSALVKMRSEPKDMGSSTNR